MSAKSPELTAAGFEDIYLLPMKKDALLFPDFLRVDPTFNAYSQNIDCLLT